MEILYIITQADGGGAQRYVLSLAKHFHGAIAAGAEAESLFRDAEALGLKTFRLKRLKRKRGIKPVDDVLAIFEIRNLIRSYKPHIVHLNSSRAGFLGSLAAAGLKTKIIFTAHGFVFNEPLTWPLPWLLAILEKFASVFRDHIIAVSEKDRVSALAHKIISPAKITTVHNGIPTINFLSRDETRGKLNLPSDKFIFGTIANFYKTKGLDILIEAVTLLEAKLRDQCLFVLIGYGAEEQNLIFNIEDLGLENIIRLAGKIDNANKYLKAFDAYILPSRKEGFPFALLDALQAGLPIIATNVGGNDEAVGYGGLLVEPNAKSIAAAISELMTDKSKLPALSKKALARSLLFTEKQMLDETQKVYEKVLGK